ncbi:alpha/beta fold hydrolase [Streptomyces sp. NBC_00268]|uniref:alpha/beta fold hydrolase n=1 Tax=unclassified Streptomyces TaxID=2593676 RepID=UPI00224E22A9|nr:alpha/beta hydrolase [Streptomyces sp. NBC_00268]MCX5191260.1 alpha/beta hydrolase [Streptomyces sp. NBC_00268]
MAAAAAETHSRTVETPYGRLHVRDTEGEATPVVALHGFPDDSRIYNRLTPHLAPHRVVSLDFRGFGHSERPEKETLEPGQREAELDAVLDALELDRVTLVGHDASGAVAVNYALAHSERVAGLVLLNCYYGDAPALRLPEMIRLLGDPNFTPLADALVSDPKMRGWLLAHTRRRFGYALDDPEGVAAASIVPQWFGEDGRPDALVAIRAWTATLYPEMAIQDQHIANGELKELAVPVTLAFGEDDAYLNPELARHIQGLFANADLHLIKDASHWPQWDQPQLTAQLIRESGN